MTPTCPQCQQPREADAWECDGCGFTFCEDLAVARTELQHKLRGAVVRTIIYCVGMLAVMCVFTMAGSTWIPALVVVAILSGLGGGSHRISVLRNHLAMLDRRHVPLPAAKIHRP